MERTLLISENQVEYFTQDRKVNHHPAELDPGVNHNLTHRYHSFLRLNNLTMSNAEYDLRQTIYCTHYHASSTFGHRGNNLQGD